MSRDDFSWTDRSMPHERMSQPRLPMHRQGLPAAVPKSFGAGSSAHRVQAFLRQTQRTAIARHVVHAPTPEPVVEPRVIPAPSVALVFLLCPGCDVFRSYVEESAPQIDAETGDVVHWLVLGNPRWSQTNFRQLAENCSVTLESLDAEWDALVREWAPERNAIANETRRLAMAHGVRPDDLPIALAFAVGSEYTPLHIRLPRHAMDNVLHARELVERIRASFSRDRFEALMRQADGCDANQLWIAVREQAAQLSAAYETAIGPTTRVAGSRYVEKMAFVSLVADGERVMDAEKLAGVSRQAVHQDPKFKKLLQVAKALAATGRSNDRSGTKLEGIVEATDDHDDEERSE